MRILYVYLIAVLPLMLLIPACGGTATGGKDDDDKPNANPPYIIKETLATGDTGMTRLAGIKRVNALDILCQHWEVGNNEGATSAELLENARGGIVVPGLDIFTDSSYVASPRGDFAAGHWRIKQEGKEQVLVLTTGTQERAWHINELNSANLRLTANTEAGTNLYLNLSSDGMIHRNRLNDPFHPQNNQWRIQPDKPETDSAIANRAKQCVKFYALFYRDNILRQKPKINFAGLPDIFEWYNGGIGMPDWEDIHDSWLRCFYDSTQARKGYDVLRKVIVDYEFDWARGVPDWRMKTQNVLEQMYHKMK